MAAGQHGTMRINPEFGFVDYDGVFHGYFSNRAYYQNTYSREVCQWKFFIPSTLCRREKRGWENAYFMNGQGKEAMEAEEKALNLQPENKEFKKNLKLYEKGMRE